MAKVMEKNNESQNTEEENELLEQANGLENIDISKDVEVPIALLETTTEEPKEATITIPNPKKEVNNSPKKSKTMAVYPYTDEEGNVLYEIERRRGNREPYLTRHKKENGEYKYELPKCDMVIYNLPNVKKAIKEGRIIWIVEGESKADTLNKLGFVATTCAFKGEDKWHSQYNKYLEGAKTILILVDNDEKAEQFAESTTQTLLIDLEETTGIYKYHINEIYKGIKEGGDIDDLLHAIGEERTINTLNTIEANH